MSTATSAVADWLERSGQVLKEAELCTSCRGWEDRPHQHLSLPDPPGTTRLAVIAAALSREEP